MNEKLGRTLEVTFETMFGMATDGEWWRAPIPLVRMSFGQLVDPRSRVQAASSVSEEVLAEILSGSRVNVRLTLWKNESPAFGGQLSSMSELDELGLRDVIDLSDTEMATIVYATIEHFQPSQIRELLLRMYRAEMGLDPSLQATIVIWRLDTPSAAVHIADDRGLAMISPVASFAESISRSFERYVY